MGFGKGCKMSALLIQACFYFGYKIVEKYRLRGTSGGHLLRARRAADPALGKCRNWVSVARQSTGFC